MKNSYSRQTLIPIVVFLMVSGCLDNTMESPSEEITSKEGTEKSYSVVAPVDTGINPYHIHFQKNESLPQWFLDDFGVTMTCDLTQTGTWEERVEADRETCWNLITYNDTVYFSGTRIIGAWVKRGGVILPSWMILMMGTGLPLLEL